MSTNMMTRRFTQSTLLDLQSWWLKGAPAQQDQAVPPELFKQWFGSSDAVDQECREKYATAAREAVTQNVEDIMRIVTGPHEAVGAVLLLDQIPRNVFRGSEAKKVYKEYDPKALALARLCLQDRDYGRREILPTFAHAMWLYMPLMHSEDVKDHHLLQSLLAARQKTSESDVERQGVERIAEFDEKHRVVLERFGRYPSRNEAMERESTSEEAEFLKSGSGW